MFNPKDLEALIKGQPPTKFNYATREDKPHAFFSFFGASSSFIVSLISPNDKGTLEGVQQSTGTRFPNHMPVKIYDPLRTGTRDVADKYVASTEPPVFTPKR